MSYDANGNMTELNGYTFGWTNRRLTSATSTDNSISYTYNYDGIRTSKTINGITTYYVVDENNNVVKQYELENDVETNVIEFVYDSNGSPIYFTYNNATYYYEKNLQGDIVAILDANGNTVVEYAYNIWGELVSITGTLADTIGAINPLRYRGYYYDTETNLYYLQSRYYSPDLMRFISQDDPVLSNDQGQPLGSNLYAYCLNNPVMNSDPSGCFGSPVQWVMAAIGGIAGWFFGDYIAKKLGYKSGWKYWAIRTGVVVGGSVIGWFAGTSLLKLARVYLTSQPTLLLKVVNKLGAAVIGTKIVYDMFKLALYDAGSIVLSAKKCPIAKEAYHQGLYGGGKKWSSAALNKKIKNNTYFKDQLKNAMSKVTGNTVENKKISLNFTSGRDMDLYLAIGKIDVYVSGTKSNGKWNLKVTGTDIYNFDSFRLNTGFSVGNIANDVGVIMQRVKMMKPYTISVSFSTTC